jgi:hypothetical protein
MVTSGWPAKACPGREAHNDVAATSMNAATATASQWRADKSLA